MGNDGLLATLAAGDLRRLSFSWYLRLRSCTEFDDTLPVSCAHPHCMSHLSLPQHFIQWGNEYFHAALAVTEPKAPELFCVHVTKLTNSNSALTADFLRSAPLHKLVLTRLMQKQRWNNVFPLNTGCQRASAAPSLSHATRIRSDASMNRFTREFMLSPE